MSRTPFRVSPLSTRSAPIWLYLLLDADQQPVRVPVSRSKYRLDGRRVESPAPRTLDRFFVQAIADDETTVLAEASLTDNFFQPLQLPSGTAFIRVDTGNRKQGPSQPLLCDFQATARNQLRITNQE